VKKRVLQFIGSFNQGGSERQAVTLMRSLLADGTFDVYAATLNKEGVLLAEAESLGMPPIPEFKLTSFFNPNFIRQVRACSAYMRENEIDVVHTHDFYTNIFGMAAAMIAGTTAKVASKRETGGMRSPMQDLVENLAFGRADAIVVNSEAVALHLADRAIETGKLKVIYNGLDTGRFDDPADGRDSVCNIYDLPPDGRFVTIVANLRHDVKNIPMLLRAAKRVAESVPDARFVIAGEGELELGLRAMAAELGVAERVYFIGRCTDVPSLLAASYACVLTSTAEGFSNSILEYMAAGKPVAATNVGGAAEAVAEGETGYLVESDDDAALAERLITLLHDTDLAERLGAAGRRAVAERFSLAAQAGKTVELYNSLLRNK